MATINLNELPLFSSQGNFSGDVPWHNSDAELDWWTIPSSKDDPPRETAVYEVTIFFLLHC